MRCKFPDLALVAFARLAPKEGLCTLTRMAKS